MEKVYVVMDYCEVPEYPRESGEGELGVFNSLEKAQDALLKDFVRFMKCKDNQDDWVCNFTSNSISVNDGTCYIGWDIDEFDKEDWEKKQEKEKEQGVVYDVLDFLDTFKDEE